MNFQYRGLILFYCPNCDSVRTVFSDEEKKSITCRVCNTKTYLQEPATGVTCKCECGRFIKAVTNCEKDIFEFNCKCGYPLTVEYHKAKMRYGGI